MRPTSYLSIAFALLIAGALVVAFFVDDTKSVVSYLATSAASHSRSAG